MRYRGQSFELEVTRMSGDLAKEFHRVHRERYGDAQEQSEIEIVSARLRSVGIVKALSVRRTTVRARKQIKPQKKVRAYLSGQAVEVGVHQREELTPGNKLKVTLYRCGVFGNDSDSFRCKG